MKYIIIIGNFLFILGIGVALYYLSSAERVLMKAESSTVELSDYITSSAIVIKDLSIFFIIFQSLGFLVFNCIALKKVK